MLPKLSHLPVPAPLRRLPLPFVDKKVQYVKYDPNIDMLTPEDEKTMDRIVASIEDFVRESPKINDIDYHARDAHAKGYCALKAEFTILPNLPDEYAQGVYAMPGKHEAVIRYSNGLSRVDVDRNLGLALGLAIKVFDIPGKKLAPGEEDSPNMDFNLINHPVFFCNRIEDYEYISAIFRNITEYMKHGELIGKARVSAVWATRGGHKLPTKQSLKTLKAFNGFTSIKPQNALLYSYFSMGAVRHGDYMAKIRVKPTKASVRKILQRKINRDLHDEAIRLSILDEIRKHDFEYDVQIQLCRNLDDQPINEITDEWKEKDAPFVTVAKLRIPQQKVPDDGNFDIMENLSFTPFRCPEQNRPIGNLQHSRLRAYEAASKLRHKLNGVKREEPRNLAELFDDKQNDNKRKRLFGLF